MREKKIRGNQPEVPSLLKITAILERNDGWEIDTEY